MARFVLSGIGSIPGNTTKTVHMYGPVGWQIVSGGWQFTTDGSLSLQASHPALPGNRLKVGFGPDEASWGYADGSTPVSDPVEGWTWIVKNTNEASRQFKGFILVEEGHEFLIGNDAVDWPVVVV
jgi:hypothetical protein